MKKQLLIAAIAATMSAASLADISIKGDAHLRYANYDDDAGTSIDTTGQRVRLHVTGKSGDTTVKLGLRNDGGTRVSGGPRDSGINTDSRKLRGTSSTGSGRGLSLGCTTDTITCKTNSNQATFATDYLFITTKIGALNIKAGDWWDTSGLGLVRKGQANPDQVELSTKVGKWKVSVETGVNDNSVIWGAEGKLAGWDLDFEYDTAENAGYTDVAVKGKFGALGVAAEVYTSDADADANVVHLWTKAADITWHVARAEWSADNRLIADESGLAPGADRYVNTYADDRANNSKFSPLGVSILGSAPGINGNLAIGNVNGKGQAEATVTGVRADAKVAGMGVQATIGNLEVGPYDDGFNDIIVTRSLGKASNIKFSTGAWNDIRTSGLKISVKF